jgi:hypothetical protein
MQRLHDVDIFCGVQVHELQTLLANKMRNRVLTFPPVSEEQQQQWKNIWGDSSIKPDIHELLCKAVPQHVNWEIMTTLFSGQPKIRVVYMHHEHITEQPTIDEAILNEETPRSIINYLAQFRDIHVEFYDHLYDAYNHVCSGDVILLFPGIHGFDSGTRAITSFTVIGLGQHRSETILSLTNSTLECLALQICNLKLVSNEPAIILGNYLGILDCDARNITVAADRRALIKNTNIYDTNGPGLRLSHKADLIVHNCGFYNCSRGGRISRRHECITPAGAHSAIELNLSDNLFSGAPFITISDVQFIGNHGNNIGIFIDCDIIEDIDEWVYDLRKFKNFHISTSDIESYINGFRFYGNIDVKERNCNTPVDTRFLKYRHFLACGDHAPIYVTMVRKPQAMVVEPAEYVSNSPPFIDKYQIIGSTDEYHVYHYRGSSNFYYIVFKVPIYIIFEKDRHYSESCAICNNPLFGFFSAAHNPKVLLGAIGQSLYNEGTACCLCQHGHMLVKSLNII